jgi:predicted nucleotidyltransferase
MATALNMTEREMEKMAQMASSFRSLSVIRDVANKDKLLANVRKVADVLRRRYGAAHVVLFGSLAYDADWWSNSSDIDLAVKGLSGKNYWRAWKTVEDMLPDIKVDFVDFEMATNSLKTAIDDYGVEL